MTRLDFCYSLNKIVQHLVKKPTRFNRTCKMFDSNVFDIKYLIMIKIHDILCQRFVTNIILGCFCSVSKDAHFIIPGVCSFF